jgi:phospholipid transport system substrate-binding protein
VRTIAAFVLVVAFAMAAPAAHADSHTDTSVKFINDLSNQAISALSDKSISTEDRREKFRSLFREGFAVNGIARFVAGRYWRSAGEDERAEYLQLFEDVIVNTWADRFSQYSGEKVIRKGGSGREPLLHRPHHTCPVGMAGGQQGRSL